MARVQIRNCSKAELRAGDAAGRTCGEMRHKGAGVGSAGLPDWEATSICAASVYKICERDRSGLIESYRL